MSDAIARGARWLERTTAERPWSARVLGCAEAGRTVVEYAAPSGARAVGKFCGAGRGLCEFQNQARVAAALAREPRAALAVALPIHFEPEFGLILQESVRGTRLDALAGNALERAVGRAGRALAELHGLEVECGPPKTLCDHLAELVRPDPLELAREYRDFAGAIEGAVARLRAHAAAPAAAAAVPLHRDFQLRNALDTGDRCAVIDWELLARGDAAFDVGYFVTYLSTHLEPGAAARLGAIFVEGYGSVRAEPDVAARCAPYEVFNLLRRACRRYRLRDTGWEAELVKMLARLPAP